MGMTATRTTVGFAIGLALLVAIAILITMTRGIGLLQINSHDRLQTTTHAVAPTSLNEAHAPTIFNGGTSGERTTLTPGGSSNASTIAVGPDRPADIVTRAGPDDSTAGMAYSVQIQPQACTQKPCKH